jgi:ABC-type antimicrobial peptide transport system permease subunit
VGATIAWQATTLAFVGLALGIPIGVLFGRLVWQQVAQSLGVATLSTFSVPGLIATIVGALVLVNVIAFFPARSAARTRPAVALREE